VGAFKNAIQSDVLAKKFNISETIKSEMAEGYSKFMVGNFGEYKQARSHRENVKQKGCNSAFVVAYNGAKRITVQEALMITSQKWFK
jgi:N-acetylmuramoyl-L-alanine amidase